ncbi:MAG: helix-turn-helix domain-containing protein [Rhizobiaceae bacterium]|nr:helix-turn-helix domain-containing protein [Rhizobiaceae bacterium]
MEDTRREQQEWVNYLTEALGMSVSALAKNSSISPSTLNKFMNNTNEKFLLSAKTLQKLSNYSGVPVLQLPANGGRGFREQEAIPFIYDSSRDERLQMAVRNMLGNSPSRTAWQIKSYSLDLEGIMPGDIVIVDQGLSASNGKQVCAQIYNNAVGAAQTVFRLHRQPYLMTHSSKEIETPVLVDGSNVKIMGVIDGLLRQ